MNAISITESAAKRVSELISSDGSEGDMLRITVSAGGCSGFSYGFGLDNEQTDEDHTFKAHGITVIVDEMSLEIIGNSEIDFVSLQTQHTKCNFVMWLRNFIRSIR
jgi:iron-sulfur cluster insertion protein